jgi:hypothetical protein
LYGKALSIAGSNSSGGTLKQEIVPLLYALGENTSLMSLNLQGHHFGNKGASALSRALQMNTTLISIFWDDNLTGLLGFINIRNALKINQTIRNMPLPISDIGQALKSSPNPADIQQVLKEIEKLLLRNQQRM